MMALTANHDTPQTRTWKTKKGDKVPVRLEFEQRFMLDGRRSDALFDELIEPRSNPSTFVDMARPKPGILIHRIRQFYDDGDRYRHSGETWDHEGCITPFKYVKEKKKSLYLDTSYSANSEEEEDVTPLEFEQGWAKSKRRLQKIRFQVPSVIDEHRTVVDFFYTDLFTDRGRYVYAVSAEDEVMLDNTVKSLYLDFQLPIYLQQYLLCVVDSRDPEMKTFRSANMIDTRESVDAFERAISQWYESTA